VLPETGVCSGPAVAPGEALASGCCAPTKAADATAPKAGACCG